MKIGLNKRLLILCLFLIAAAFSSGQAFGQAQADEFPLVLWIRGDLYRVDSLGAAPTPITHNGTISGPAISPDGSVIAYKAASQVGLDALNRIQTSGKIADFDLPGDIYAADIAGRCRRRSPGSLPTLPCWSMAWRITRSSARRRSGRPMDRASPGRNTIIPAASRRSSSTTGRTAAA